MKEHPILFSGEMVKAIIEGRKTQTRRPMKPQPQENAAFWYPWPETKKSLAYGSEKNFVKSVKEDFAPWKPGDRLWLRETWRPYIKSGSSGILYRADNGNKNTIGEDFEKLKELLKRTGGELHYKYGNWGDPEPREVKQRLDWRPSIHMPRWASRITLEVKAVRAERVQEITQEGVFAEGIIMLYDGSFDIIKDAPFGCGTAIDAFAHLWDSIYGEGAWEFDPFVWVTEFEVAK